MGVFSHTTGSRQTHQQKGRGKNPSPNPYPLQTRKRNETKTLFFRSGIANR